jgi:hypothetical protein
MFCYYRINKRFLFQISRALNAHLSLLQHNEIFVILVSPAFFIYVLRTYFAGIVRSFGCLVKSRLIRSVLNKLDRRPFFKSHFKGTPSQDNQKTGLRRLIISSIFFYQWSVVKVPLSGFLTPHYDNTRPHLLFTMT